jgi:hypothetical protein
MKLKTILAAFIWTASIATILTFIMKTFELSSDNYYCLIWIAIFVGGFLGQLIKLYLSKK